MVSVLIILLVAFGVAWSVRGDYPSASQSPEEDGNEDPYDKGNLGQ